MLCPTFFDHFKCQYFDYVYPKPYWNAYYDSSKHDYIMQIWIWYEHVVSEYEKIAHWAHSQLILWHAKDIH